MIRILIKRYEDWVKS